MMEHGYQLQEHAFPLVDAIEAHFVEENIKKKEVMNQLDEATPENRR